MPMSLNKLKDWALIVGPASCLVIFSLFAIWVGHEPATHFTVSFPPLPDISINVPQAQLTKMVDTDIERQGTQGLSDPFGRRPPLIKTDVEAQPIVKELSLSLIVAANGNRYCRVNGRLLREGEKWTGFAVKKIEQSGVLFDTDTGQIFLKPGEKKNIILKPTDEPDSSLHDINLDNHKDKGDA